MNTPDEFFKFTSKTSPEFHIARNENDLVELSMIHHGYGVIMRTRSIISGTIFFLN